MLKNKIAKLLTVMMVTSTTAVALPTITAMADTNIDNVEVVEALKGYDEYTYEQLGYAIEEMSIALNEISAGSYDTERVMIFADTAIARLNGLDEVKLAEIENGLAHGANVKNCYNIVKKMVDAKNEEIATQLAYAVEEIEISLKLLSEGCRDYEMVLAYAAPAIERVRPMVISVNNPLYEDYRFVVEGYDKVLLTCTERYEATYKELHHAHTEILIALNELNAANSTEGGRTEEAKKRILTFAATAVERIRPEMENKGTAYKYWSAYYEDVSRLYGEIIRNLDTWIFDGSEDDNMLIEPPILDGSEDDNFLIDGPILDGSEDDNMLIEPPVLDGSEDDNMLIEPPVLDGSEDDNMLVEPPVLDGSGEDNMLVDPPVEEDKKDKLPATGNFGGSGLVLSLGAMLTGAGAVLFKKRK